MAKLMSSYDWSQTLLGEIATWSSALKTALGILLNANTPMFCIWGCDRVLLYNDSYLTLLQEQGYTLPIGQPLKQASGAWEGILASVEEVFATGQSVNGRQIFELKQGNAAGLGYIWSYNPIWNDVGQVEGVFATGNRAIPDLPVRLPEYRAETVLEKSEARFHQIANLSPIIIRIAAPDGSGAWFNQRWQEFTGQSLKAALGQGWLTALHSEDMANVKQQFLQAQQRQESVRLEYRLRRYDGTYCWVVDSAVPWFDDVGVYQGYVGSIVDMSACKRSEAELQQAEVALQESEALVQSILDSSNDCIKVLTPQGQLLYMNQGGLSALEVDDPNSVLNTCWVDFWQGKDYEQAKTALAVAKKGQVGHMQGYCPTMTGQPKWWDVIATPLRDISDQVNKLVVISRDITNQKQANEALQESERSLSTLISNLPGFVFRSLNDEDWTMLFLSEGVQDITGYAVKDFLEKLVTWDSLVHPEDLETVRANAAKHIAERTSIRIAYRIIDAHNRVRWVWDRATPVFSETGDIAFWEGFVTDITDRKTAEIALQFSEERYRLLNSTLSAIVWTMDAEGAFVTPQPEWEFYTGQSWEDYQGLGWLRAIHPFDRQQLWAKWQLAKDRRTAYIAEGRLWNAVSEEYRYFEIRGMAIFNSDGSVREWVGNVTDVQDRKQTEAALRESEDRFRMAIRSAQLGTWNWNLLTNELIWDTGCKAMFGLSPQADVTIETFYAGLHPEDRDWVEQVIQESLDPKNGGHYDVDYRTVGIEDGIERWISAKGKVYFNADGTPRRFTGTVLDISDRKESERERELLLQRERLAREEAEQANQIKDQFLAVLSHELRSPLNPILGWSRLLQTQKFDAAKTAQALATIERNARLQSQLVDDLLDLARILRGKLHLNNTPVYVASVIESAMEAVKTAATAKAISLSLDLDPQAQVWGDAVRLQQIVWNLLSNAIKFTPEQGQVDIELRQINNQVQITVRDTGVGIGSDFLPYIFDSFRQEDVSISRKHGGLGLGLAIVRQLVEAHGGTITAKSPGEGKGATFTVQLPLLNANLSGHSAEIQPERTFDLTGIQVLVVDDSHDARELLTILLEQYGAEVFAVGSAVEALETLLSSCPDILISDIGMPEMDGYQLIQQVRALPLKQGGQVPAIALTAYAQDADQQQAFASGYQRHLSKPLDIEKLVETVAALT